MEVGATLGGYVLEELIGEGGMGRVFLARGADGETRALKVLRAGEADDNWAALRGFIDEATLAIGVTHPNVVRTYELGEHSLSEGPAEEFYLLMEYVAGCSLAKLLKSMARTERALAPSVAVWIASEVAAGLHAVHRLKSDSGQHLSVVHRDVSPQNVLLGLSGSVKLTDFGIAKAGGRAERTRTGVIKGKVRYMAPEQALARDVDARTDVYALALVLWQMLTGRKPFFDQPKARLLRSVQRGGVPRASTFVEIPARLDDVLAEALQPDPDSRPSSAKAFSESLAEALPPVSAGASASTLIQLLFEFNREEMKTATRRAGDATVVGERTLDIQQSSASTVDAGSVLSPAESQTELDSPPHFETSDSSTLGSESFSDIEIPRSSKDRWHTIFVVVVSFALGVALTLGLLLANE